jgi:hypothetical protein
MRPGFHITILLVVSIWTAAGPDVRAMKLAVDEVPVVAVYLADEPSAAKRSNQS